MLAVALAFVLIGRRSLGAHGSLAAALIWMVNFGIVEKGRLIEIEAIYVSLTGLAFVCWLSWWSEQRSRWLTWTLPWLFLGLAMLAKGPLHLVFFYAVVVGITYRERRLRELLNPAHFVGLALMLAIFAAWAIPCLRIMQGEGVANIWTHQLSGRLSGEDFKLGGWLLNIPRGLGYFLPWTLLLGWAVVRRPTFANDRTARIAAGLASGVAISFFAVSLLPGALPRYTMPLLVPATWFVALLLADAHWELPRWLDLRRPTALPRQLRLPAVLALVACLGVVIYALAVVPLRQQRAKVRPIAAQINAVVPPGRAALRRRSRLPTGSLLRARSGRISAGRGDAAGGCPLHADSSATRTRSRRDVAIVAPRRASSPSTHGLPEKADHCVRDWTGHGRLMSGVI